MENNLDLNTILKPIMDAMNQQVSVGDVVSIIAQIAGLGILFCLVWKFGRHIADIFYMRRWNRNHAGSSGGLEYLDLSGKGRY